MCKNCGAKNLKSCLEQVLFNNFKLDVSVVSASEENSKDEGSHDKLDCDNKDNLDVSRESIEMALSDMLEAANDVIKSLESESQL